MRLSVTLDVDGGPCTAATARDRLTARAAGRVARRRFRPVAISAPPAPPHPHPGPRTAGPGTSTTWVMADSITSFGLVALRAKEKAAQWRPEGRRRAPGMRGGARRIQVVTDTPE
ncbi:hypothetical protein GCM10010207_00380 [Streptomyces atratus]|nr:hypothetical protein GCM10010207_00380 [Streptomyces atratus]